MLFLGLVFLIASGLPVGAYFVLRRNAVQRRLERIVSGVPGPADPAQKDTPQWVETVARAATPLARLSVPDEGWEGSELRLRFMRAGLRSSNAPVFFFAIKTLMAFGLPLLLWFARAASGSTMPLNKFVLLVGVVCSVGFYLPNVVLNHLIERRRLEIFESFPDALDLLTICVEAGLSLEAALNRVASEIQINSLVLATELQLVCLEFRAGSGKERALRNLALRTGVEDVDTLVAMLVQSEKFGTSIGDALRIQSDMLRVKRQQRAEERAAKVAVKLLFPLMFCIFPSILIVVAGPAMIRIAKVLPTLVGGG
ncbi:MAG: type II secretion system F family protein [Zoogloea sp.]|nr:MAG: type II secretion system F family protein [Zoogloea sp.]